MITKVLEFVAKTDKAEKDIKNLNTELENTQADLSGVESAADKATGGMISGFKGAATSITGVVKGFKTMRLAIIASGIGALVLVISSIATAFTNTEEGQNKFNKLMSVLGSITGNLVDLLADFGEKIISAFENPQKAIKDFAKLIRDNIVNRFEGLLELIPQLGKAVKLLFEGEFKEAGKVAINANAKIMLGIDNITDKTEKAIEKTKDFVNEIKEEGKIAAQISDQRAKADKLERNLLVERAKANRDRADLLEKAVNKEQFSTSQRIQFLKDAGALEDEITQKEIEAAQLRLDAKIAENALSGSTKEDLQEEAQLRANLINLETAKLTKQKEVTSQIIALTNEEKAALQALKDKKDAIAKEERDKANEKLKKEKEERDKALNVLSSFQQEFKNSLLSENEREVNAVNMKYDKLTELAEKYGQSTVDIEKARAKEIDSINQKLNEKTLADRIANQQALVSATSSALGSIAQIASAFAKEDEASQRKAFNINKAAGIAQATINTGLAVTAALTAGGNPIKLATGAQFAEAIAVGLAGAAQIATIAKTKFQSQQPSPSPDINDSGGIGGGTSGTAASQPANFNVVGQSGFNQISQAIQQQGPVQAFVVGSEVTTQQQLDNAIVSTATLGN